MSKLSKILLVTAMVAVVLSCGSAALAYDQIVGDCVWIDSNGSGTPDAGELGIDGVLLELSYIDGGGNKVVLGTTTTGLRPDGAPVSQPIANGWYSFSAALRSGYTIRVVSGIPAGYVQTYDLDDGKTTAPLTPGAAGFNHTNGNDPKLDVDFGYKPGDIIQPEYEVGDRVWHDVNFNGIQDSGEEGIDGATVKLLDGTGAVLAQTTTATVGGVDGYYLFTGRVTGQYQVEVSGTPIGWACTYDLDGNKNSNSGKFTLAGDRYDVDFGYAAVPTTGFCTFTQGGWGAKPKGNNPGTVLMRAWYSTTNPIYPTGLVVGGTYTMRFTKAEQVTAFLPQGGTAAPLKTSYDPPTGKINVLAGQVLALRLNVDFSNAGITQFGIGTLTIQQGTYAGQTVAQFLALAEAALGGGVIGANISAINDTATKINESFDNGTTNTGYIK